MSLTKHAAWLIAELFVGWVLVWVITFAVMNTMFYFGPWADPPGIDELHRVLMTLLPVVCFYRAWRRLRRDLRLEENRREATLRDQQ